MITLKKLHEKTVAIENQTGEAPEANHGSIYYERADGVRTNIPVIQSYYSLTDLYFSDDHLRNLLYLSKDNELAYLNPYGRLVPVYATAHPEEEPSFEMIMNGDVSNYNYGWVGTNGELDGEMAGGKVYPPVGTDRVWEDGIGKAITTFKIFRSELDINIRGDAYLSFRYDPVMGLPTFKQPMKVHAKVGNVSFTLLYTGVTDGHINFQCYWSGEKYVAAMLERGVKVTFTFQKV